MNKVCIEFKDGKKINLELYPEHAPITVENFLSLVKKGFYDGLCFHRVIENFMIQGGGFIYDDGLIQQPAPRTIKGEFIANGVNNTLKHTAGLISMARTMVKDSASSQFFICTVDTPHLDGQYAAFGKVMDKESLENAIAISNVETGYVDYYSDVPITPVVIKTIKEI
jgi:peptidyl-prolyl cis-trans isomerase B (cyclophilin B)